MKKTIMTFVCVVFAGLMYGQTQTTHWTQPMNFQSNMNVNSLVYLDGVEPNSEHLEIGAFCGEVCRGCALPAGMVGGHMLYMLTIASDSNGDVITFRLYDHELGQELDCECAETITFAADAILGSYPDFYTFHFTSSVHQLVQTTVLTTGWNWFSLYVEAEAPVAMLQMLETALGENGLIIKSSDFTTEYDSEWGWFGDLDDEGIVNEQMYKIEVVEACTLSLEGIPANPASHPITIQPGWNWIGFPSAVAMSLDDAFAGFAREGDMIRNNNYEIEYDPEWGWFGDFETLEPGQGYMYYSSSNVPRTLVFPAGAK